MRMIYIALTSLLLMLSLNKAVVAGTCSPTNLEACSDVVLCEAASAVKNGNLIWKKHSDLFNEIISPRLQKPSRSPKTIKSNVQNPFAQLIRITSIGGGGGGAAAAPQQARPRSGGDTLYRIDIDGNTVSVASDGGLSNKGYGQGKFRGDKGQSSDFASGGLPGGSQGKDGNSGSLGSGGGGGTGRAPDVFASSTKGGAGGRAGKKVSKIFDISKADTVVLYIDNIGNVSGNLHNPNDGGGGSGEWGDGGLGGKGFVNYTIETGDLTPIYYRKEALKRGLTCDVETSIKSAYNTLSDNQRKLIQQNLTKLGLYKSAIDGRYGKGTENGLRSFNDLVFEDPDVKGATNSFRLLYTVLDNNCKDLTCLKVVTNERANALKSAEEEKRNELTTEIEMLGSRLTEAKEALDKESSDKKQVNTELNETKKLLSAAISNSKELASQLNTFQQQRASEIENYTTYINTLEKNITDNKQEILLLQNKKKQASKETQQRQEQAAQALTKAISELVQSEERQVLLQEKLNVSESRLSDLKSSVKEVETKTKLLDATKLSLIKKILSAEMEAKILVEMAIGAQKLEVSKTSRELENRAAIIADLTATEALHKEQLLLTLHEMEKLKEDYQLAKDKIKSLSHKLLEKRIAIDSNNKTGPPSNMVALNLTEHEVETITYEISKCLRIEPNIIGNGSFVEILMDFKKDGMVKRESIALVDTDISNLLRQNAAFQAIKRATLSCENEGYSLPAEKYDQLQSIKLKFGLDIN